MRINQFARALLILCLTSSYALAQKSYVDHQVWIGGSCKLDFKKGWALTAQFRGRGIDNATYYKGSYWFLTADYKINKTFGAFLNYRYAYVDVGRFHRYAVGAEARFKKKHFTFSFRPMLQRQNQYFLGDDEQNTSASLYLRPRVHVKYEITKRLDAYIYGEPFVNLKSNQHVDWWQNAAGVKYEYAKGKKINLYYIWSPDYSKKKVHTYHIFAVDFDFTINVGKKKEKIQKENEVSPIN